MEQHGGRLVYSFKAMEEGSRFNFELKLRGLLKQEIQNYREVVVLCIGSDLFVGDCLGPLIGQRLFKQCSNADVYGTLVNPVTATNVKDALKVIDGGCKKPFIIAIDSALGADNTNIGDIVLSNVGIIPREGFGGTLPRIGNISITGTVGIVNVPFENFMKTVRLNLVMSLVDFIVSGLQNTLTSVPLLKLTNRHDNIIPMRSYT